MYEYRDPETGRFGTNTVYNLPRDPNVQFRSDSQDVSDILERLGCEEDYDSFFIVERDDNIIAAWGMNGIVPWLNKRVYRVK